MGALSDLLKQPRMVATPATIATQPSVAVRIARPALPESQESQESQGGEPEIRARLLRLAGDEGVDPAHVHRLHADDVAACHGESDDTLRAYLRALEQAARMDAGMVPVEYSHAVQCVACGPVWLWEGCPEVVTACPWCFRRKAGKRIPRPPMQCGDCLHYAPDPLNHAEGVGTCGAGKDARWPMQRHRCAEWRAPTC